MRIQNILIILTEVTFENENKALLFQVSETLTLDCGTLIFENADKNGSREISVKFRSRLLFKNLIYSRGMKNVFFWTQRCWRSILRAVLAG